MSANERLREKIDRHGPDECWPWTGPRCRDGYGQVYVAGKPRKAHAVVLEEATGEHADGRSALHRCDNPPCCNPKHLWWGTAQENRADCVRKRRQAFGERHGAAVLTREQVQSIRQRYTARSRTSGAPSLAREFGVHENTIYMIVNGNTWRN